MEYFRVILPEILGALDLMPKIWMGIVLGVLWVALNLSTAGLLDMDFGSRESPQ